MNSFHSTWQRISRFGPGRSLQAFSGRRPEGEGWVAMPENKQTPWECLRGRLPAEDWERLERLFPSPPADLFQWEEAAQTFVLREDAVQMENLPERWQDTLADLVARCCEILNECRPELFFAVSQAPRRLPVFWQQVLEDEEEARRLVAFLRRNGFSPDLRATGTAWQVTVREQAWGEEEHFRLRQHLRWLWEAFQRYERGRMFHGQKI